MALCGLISSVGHLLPDAGLPGGAREHGRRPFEYVMIGWAVLWGYVFWGDVPGPSTVLGVATTVAAGVYVLHHQARAQLDPGAAQQGREPILRGFGIAARPLDQQPTPPGRGVAALLVAVGRFARARVRSESAWRPACPRATSPSATPSCRQGSPASCLRLWGVLRRGAPHAHRRPTAAPRRASGGRGASPGRHAVVPPYADDIDQPPRS